MTMREGSDRQANEGTSPSTNSDTSPNTTNGCFECGSSAGSPSKLCPTCVATHAAKRAQRKRALEVDLTGDRDTFLFRIVRMSIAAKMMILMLAVLGMVAAVAMADSWGVSAILLILLMSALASGLLALTSLLIMLGTIFRGDAEVGRKLLIFFPLIYPLLWSAQKEQSSLWEALKTFAIAHVVGVALLLGTVITAASIGINLFSPTTYGFTSSPGDTSPRLRSTTDTPPLVQRQSPNQERQQSDFSGYDY